MLDTSYQRNNNQNIYTTKQSVFVCYLKWIYWRNNDENIYICTKNKSNVCMLSGMNIHTYHLVILIECINFVYWIMGYCTEKKIIMDTQKRLYLELNVYIIPQQICYRCCYRSIPDFVTLSESGNKFVVYLCTNIIK